MSPWFALTAAGLGMAAGPLLRLEAFQSSVPVGTPRRARCPRCHDVVVRSEARWHDIARLALGKCRLCALPIGPPIATVEVATAVSFGTLAMMVDKAMPLVAYWMTTAIGIALAIVDVAVHRLPDRLTALLAATVVVLLAAQALVTDCGHRFFEALAAGLGATLFYLALSLLTAGGVGLGDAKLAFGLGIAVGWTGWTAVFWMTILSWTFSAIVAATLLGRKRAGRRDAIAHGPFMLSAALTMVVLAYL